ncbi:MAG: hypothetical protein KF894_34120 [Labilithrix sp.]|nr:hypothetical protein [Labilithrix sp.]
MSYSIDRVEVLGGQLSIRVVDLVRLRHEHRESLPEHNFIVAAVEQLAALDYVDELPLVMKHFKWCGTWSGNSYEEVFLAEVVPCLRGRAELVFTWERGDYISGLIIEDGKATECDVKHVLVPRGAQEGGTQP